MYLRDYQQSSYGVVLAYEVYGLLGLSGLWDSVARRTMVLGVPHPCTGPGTSSARGSSAMLLVCYASPGSSYHPMDY